MLEFSPSFRHRRRGRLRRPGTRGTLVLAALGVLAGIAGIAPPPAARAQEPSLTDVVSRSGFIFLGTVKSIGSAPAGTAKIPNQAVVATVADVTVERVLEALPPVERFTGREVQVRLRSPHQPGDRAVFFTYVQSAGTVLGVVEVASEPAGQEPEIERRIRAARQELADRALAARLASAQLVVVGVFGEGRPTPEARVHKGEHDPLWWRAPIRVESVEKGSAPDREGGQIYANYASSDDVVWRNAPKPRPGQEGIYLLQPYPEEAEKELRTPGLFLIDPLDALPKSELERVRRLLGAAPVR